MKQFRRRLRKWRILAHLYARDVILAFKGSIGPEGPEYNDF